VPGVGREGGADAAVDDAVAVELRGVEVVDAELDRAACWPPARGPGRCAPTSTPTTS
jgi:hypothetical protein